jgi:hypothetical protein
MTKGNKHLFDPQLGTTVFLPIDFAKDTQQG